MKRTGSLRFFRCFMLLMETGRRSGVVLLWIFAVAVGENAIVFLVKSAVFMIVGYRRKT